MTETLIHTSIQCPPNIVQPLLCPAGYYCSNDTTTITVCPSGAFCPSGTTEPIGCDFLAICHEGSKSANKIGIAIFFVILFGLMAFIFNWKSKVDTLRRLKHKYQFQALAITSDSGPMDQLASPLPITFNDLSLTLRNGVEVLSGVSGSLAAGRTTAIIGPPGSSKSSLLAILAGKRHRSEGTLVAGSGSHTPRKLRKLIGFVAKEDVLLEDATVRELLMHSARMRLPREWAYERVRSKVNEILETMDLHPVMDKVIKDARLTLAERKRLSIAIELVAEPHALFLDEPTTGLDSSSARDVCTKVRAFAQRGLTVAAIVNSPSPSVFATFDDVILLGKGGRVVYCGAREKCLEYFYDIGFTMPAGESPSDFFMDVMKGKIPNCFKAEFEPADLFLYWEQHQKGTIPFEGLTRMDPETAAREAAHIRDASNPPERRNIARRRAEKLGTNYYTWTDWVATILAVVFRETAAYTRDVAEEFCDSCASIWRFVSRKPHPVRDTAQIHVETLLYLKRSFFSLVRKPTRLVVELLVHLALGIVVSIVTSKMGYQVPQPDQVCTIAPVALQSYCRTAQDDMPDAGMFISIGALLGGLILGAQTFGPQKSQYWRIISSGSSTLPYYLAHIIVDIPRITLSALVYAISLVLFFNYRQAFVTILVLVEFLYFACFAMGYWMSVMFRKEQWPVVIVALTLVWGIVFSGVHPTLSTVESDSNYTIIRWLWAISAPRWAIEAFWIKEVQARLEVPLSTPPANGYSWGNYGPAIAHILGINMLWSVLTVLTMKLLDRQKQK
ncbi:hypothetical protein BDK51DRAFT_16402 [Blyttiomyces helicus]|uniref:ABC transporter domain-containing protein n=1 Tax=Blyttiomyces helicus TaxID=388810 RepID=A0A4P9WMI2_9FUNG|nr:hypothetical protein BDK51DRAFT_16402 [Blyttiomyces helicus]|eukprot:RKO92888.1 hypothetical protein BDK51DRAFT_16402 [Blyttiomyces helicus]